jgi:glycosyltransferase involved in cell wall biosynthesis
VTGTRDEPLRILLTAHHRLDPNQGAPGATLGLGRALERLGHRVELFSFDDLPPRLGPRAQELLFPEFAALALRSAEKRGLDVVDALTGDAWVWAVARRKPSPRRPLLVTRSQGLEHVYHESRVVEARADGRTLPWLSRAYHGGLRLREVEQSLRRADLALFMNDADLRYAVESLGVSAGRVAETRNAIADVFLGRALEPVGPEVRIAQVGTYAERKGIKYSVPALRSVLDRHQRVRAGLIGTGCPRERVLADFPENLHQRIEVVSRYENRELPDLLAPYHVELLPSLAEGAPIVLLEAMACGLAPVTSDIPGALALVEHERDALVVPAGDAKALERAVERLLADRELLERLRRAGHAKAQRYGWDEVARETVDLYRRSVLGNAASPASGSRR